MIHLVFNLKHHMEFEREVLLKVGRDEFTNKIEELVDIEYRAFKTRVDNRILNYLKSLKHE